MKQIILTLLTGLCLVTMLPAASAVETKQSGVLSLLEQGNKAWAGQNMEQAEKYYRDAVALDPDSPQARASLANLLQSTNRVNEAIDEFQTAITLDHENAGLFVALAIAYVHQKSYGMAKQMADEALRLDPSMTNAAKLKEYIDVKEEVLQRAANADVSATDGDLPPGHPTSSKAH